MVEVGKVRALLFAKNLQAVATFYAEALDMKRESGDDAHVLLKQGDFELIVHQIPKPIADSIRISEPPLRREGGSLRLDYPIPDIRAGRARAKSLGGGIDDSPPPWADSGTNFFLGFDPEGNVFGVSEQNDRQGDA